MIESTQLFKSLSDETRLFAILLIFIEGELCVCELMEALNQSQPKISRHLAYLRSAGILEDTRRGQWVFYSMAKKPPAWLEQVLSAACDANAVHVKKFQSNLSKMKNRPLCCD